MLIQSFNQQASNASPERMEKLKEMLRQSKTGQEALNFVEQEEIRLVFDKTQDSFGYFNPDRNKVALNPVHCDEDLATTFVHEVRHAWQEKQMGLNEQNLTPKSTFEYGFAIEADACATEVAFAHEMKQTNPEIWNAHQKTRYAPISTAFEETLTKTGDQTQAKEAAFLAWYTLSSLKETYADSYVGQISSFAKTGFLKENLDEKYLSTPLDLKDFSNKVLKDFDGNNYLSETNKLETKETLTITEAQARRMCVNLLPFTDKHKKTPEKLGLDKLSVKEISGKKNPFLSVYNTMKEERDKRQRNIQAFLAHSQKQGR